MKINKKGHKPTSEEALLKKLEPKLNNRRNKQQNKRPNLLLVLGISLLFAAIAGIVGYNIYLDYQDRQRFETVKRSVKQVHKQLQNIETSDTQWFFESSCSLPGVKFQEAQPRCVLSTGNTIKLDAAIEARAQIDSINQVIQSSSLFTQVQNERKKYPDFETALRTKEDGPNLSNRYAHRVYKEKATGMECSLNYELRRSGSENRSGQPILRANFSCGDDARETWFPRNDI